MKNKTTRFLITSLIGVALLCVCVFSFFAIHMSNQSSSGVEKSRGRRNGKFNRYCRRSNSEELYLHKVRRSEP